MPYRATIAAAYDAGVEEEYRRLMENPLREAEYQLIIDLLDEYIPGGATVIDIGSGPGRFAEYLLKRNCKVGVVDLSAKSLKAFSDRMEGSCCQDKIIFNRVSCATQLDWIEDHSSDAVLLMGPLYHLIDTEHRNWAIMHCKRILKPGGYLFSVFLSPFPFLDKANGLQADKDLYAHRNFYKQIDCNIITHTNFKGFDVPQYRCWPEEAEKYMHSNGFRTERLKNIEGIASCYSSEEINKFTETDKKLALIDQLRSTSEIKKLIGMTQQFIYVGRSA